MLLVFVTARESGWCSGLCDGVFLVWTFAPFNSMVCWTVRKSASDRSI